MSLNSSKLKTNFWLELNRPFLVIAPMDDVTDFAYRQIVSKVGKPDVMFTEFVSADGLCSVGKNRLLHDLKFKKNEAPIVAQIFGSNPENFTKAANLISRLGFDGIDINMGCPFKTVEKQGAGAALIKTPLLAQKIILATKRGADKLPVSVKTRIGYKSDTSATWIPQILKTAPSALTIHARTQKEKSKAKAHWDVVKRISDMITNSKSKTLLIGNGDVKDYEDALKKAKMFNVDGVMIGRAAMNNPWFFTGRNESDIHMRERIDLLIEHAKLHEKYFKGIKGFYNMNKFYSSYLNGFNGAKKLRNDLMDANNSSELINIIDGFLGE